MGSDSSRGEVRQLVVEGGWWKASEIPEEDLNDEAADRDKIGCLISEASLFFSLNGACLTPNDRGSTLTTHCHSMHRLLFPVRTTVCLHEKAFRHLTERFLPSAQASTLRTTSSSTAKASLNSSVETSLTLQWSNCSLTLRSDERRAKKLDRIETR